MFVFTWRRRLLHLRQIPGGGGGIDPLQSNPGAIPLSRSYSSTAVAGAPNSEPCRATISYLISCGLSPAAAAATARCGCIRSTAKADAVCALLRRYGFSDADIARVARGAPLLLSVDPDRIIRPKLDFFASLGFEPRKLASAPLLLARSLDKHIVPCIQFLRGIIGTDDGNGIRLGFSRNPRALMVDLDNYMRPAVEALRSHGLTEEAISKLLVMQMSVLTLSPHRIGKIFEDLNALGMCSVTGTRFLYCFRVMCHLKRETWLRKVAVYRSFGLTEGEVLRAFKTQPTILVFTDENIKKKLRFFLDELKLVSADVMRCPVVLAYSMEKTILPRCAVLRVLMREGKIGRDIKLLPALLGSSRVFSGKYVFRYSNDVPDVVKAYDGKIKFQGFRSDQLF